jgi:hypothetical protein
VNRLRALSLVVFAAAACGGPQKLGSTGATCFRDDDCEPGMICVAPTADDIHRVCSTDPTPLISMVQGPPAAMAGAATVAGAAGTAGSATGGVTTGGAPGAGSNAGGTATAGKPSTGGKGGSGGTAAGGTDTAGTGGSAGTAAGTAGTSGSAGTAPEGGAPL